MVHYSHMLKKQHRLTKQAFDGFFSAGTRFHGQFVQVVYTPTHDFHGAVVVGKKVYNKAHDRNRLRRRLYGVLYRQKVAKNSKGVYIVLVKPAAKTVPYPQVRDELEMLLNKIN